MTNINIIDGSSIYPVIETFTQTLCRPVKMDYRCLKSVLNGGRYINDNDKNIFLLSLDRNSEGQRRFKIAIENCGFSVGSSDYHSNFVSPPPGEDSKDRWQSLSGQIGYILGRAVGNHTDKEEKHITVLSHSFNLYHPMMDVAVNHPRITVSLAYFSQYLDDRWRHSGVLNKNSKHPIRFLDLNDHIQELLEINSKKNNHEVEHLNIFDI